jgi:hypothetical protein
MSLGAIYFDGHAKLIGRETFFGERKADKLSGTYSVRGDGRGELYLSVKRSDGYVMDQRFVLHLESSGLARLVSGGPTYIDWNGGDDPNKPAIDARILATIAGNMGHSTAIPTQEKRNRATIRIMVTSASARPDPARAVSLRN